MMVRRFLEVICVTYDGMLKSEIKDLEDKHSELLIQYAFTKEIDLMNVEIPNNNSNDGNNNEPNNGGVKVCETKKHKKEMKTIKKKLHAKRQIQKLIKGETDEDHQKFIYNWKTKYGHLSYLKLPCRNYVIDSLGIALHAIYNCNNFSDAIEKGINLLSNSSEIGSIVGQIAGAMFGYQSIVSDKRQDYLVKQLSKWDNWDFAFRGGIIIYLYLCILIGILRTYIICTCFSVIVYIG